MADCTKCKYAIWSFWVANGESCFFVEGCMMRGKNPETCEESVDGKESTDD